MANAIDSIMGQEKALGMLAAFLENATIPHALVFSGLSGSGKTAVARLFAMACNCTGSRPGSDTALPACGSCRSCRKIEAASHPDILHIKPSGNMIKVRQIRELLETIALRPFEARMRVVVLQDAHTLNPSAGNALLKALEEPPGNTIFILTTGELSTLMPTIVSRCQHVRFRPVDRSLILDVLLAEQGPAQPEAELAARLSGGSLSRARQLLDSDWIQFREWLLKQTAALTSAPPGILLAIAAVLTERKDRVADAIAILQSWFRDLLVCRQAPDRLINQDLEALARTAAAKETTESLLKKLKALDTVSRRLEGNANIRLCLEGLLLKLARI